MKQLLVFNQFSESELPFEEIRQLDFQVEQGTSISEMSRQLFRKRAEDHGNTFDIFLVNTYELTSEIINFLCYVRKTKPRLPLIIFSRSREKKLLLQTHLKGILCHISESNHPDDILNQIMLSTPDEVEYQLD